jgi:hypothetical protein
MNETETVKWEPSPRELSEEQLEELGPEIQAIQELHNDILLQARSAITRAIEIGGKLEAVRSKLKHGQWLPFVEWCGISPNTARNYVRLFKHREELKYAKFEHLTDAYAETLVERQDGRRLIMGSSKLQELTLKWKEECRGDEVLTVVFNDEWELRVERI